MKIGIFGGSFDPIHKGHLEIIGKLFDDFHMDKVIVIPTNVSYYKKSKAMFTFDKKLELCTLAINNSDKLSGLNIEVSDIERTIKEDEGFAHTILRLKDIYPNDELYTVIGSDSYNYLNTWRSYQLIYENSKLIVAKRPENRIDESIGIKHLVLEMNNDNSSTEIRKKIIDLILE
jgi:nicotinate-nucleotide adenylyltransferase